ncbi:MAG: pyridoxamine 5-phosphate oxidase family protein [Oscillospiraceae bacterium]|nr:pyridoxamine 5-phosphate oxidase family protein [Oscillospiraceae bacterium]
MRRSDREVKDIQTITEIIQRCDVCRIAINHSPVPYILPLNFGMETVDGNIILYFHGASEGTKYELLKQNNRVSFEMDCSHRLVTTPETGNCTMEYESVIGDGYIEFVEDSGKAHALTVLMGQYHQENFPFNQAVFARTTFMKLEVQNMTCKVLMKK